MEFNNRVAIAVAVDNSFRDYRLELTMQELREMAKADITSPFGVEQRLKNLDHFESLIPASVVNSKEHQKYLVGRERGRRIFMIRINHVHMGRGFQFVPFYERCRILAEDLHAHLHVSDDGLEKTLTFEFEFGLPVVQG